jgi:hypothetical protein
MQIGGIFALAITTLINFKWNKGDVITIGFMDNGKYIQRNTYDELSKTKLKQSFVIGSKIKPSCLFWHLK